MSRRRSPLGRSPSSNGTAVRPCTWVRTAPAVRGSQPESLNTRPVRDADDHGALRHLDLLHVQPQQLARPQTVQQHEPHDDRRLRAESKSPHATRRRPDLPRGGRRTRSAGAAVAPHLEWGPTRRTPDPHDGRTPRRQPSAGSPSRHLNQSPHNDRGTHRCPPRWRDGPTRRRTATTCGTPRGPADTRLWYCRLERFQPPLDHSRDRVRHARSVAQIELDTQHNRPHYVECLRARLYDDDRMTPREGSTM